MSNALWPHGLQYARLPCPSPSPGVCSVMSIQSVMPSNHLFFCHPFSSCPQSFPASRSFLMSWPNDWNFSFSISPSNEYSGLISFRMDWFGLLAVQGTLKSFLQHHNSKASVLLRSAFWMVQLSHLHMITGKTVSLTFYDIKVVIWVSFLISLMAWWKTSRIVEPEEWSLVPSSTT